MLERPCVSCRYFDLIEKTYQILRVGLRINRGLTHKVSILSAKRTDELLSKCIDLTTISITSWLLSLLQI